MPSANGAIRVVAAGDGVTYVGGDFTQIGGVSRNDIAAIDNTTGAVTSWDPDASNIVYEILV